MGTVVLAGATSGSTTLTPVDAVTATITLPSATSILTGAVSAGTSGDVLVSAGAASLPAWTTPTGTGAPVKASSPAFSGTVTGANLTFSGQVSIGAAISTSATSGHTAVASCIGPPTGVPTPANGCISLIFDSANQYLYAYLNGSWKKTTQFT
jgi:hypothetical protein